MECIYLFISHTFIYWFAISWTEKFSRLYNIEWSGFEVSNMFGLFECLNNWCVFI